ncbi:membrane protein insertase YidC [uncultured Jatrophihabitans sp.]|uniref:membrane protein insertase YidC n=1 Tax=uncultured Jatrophihabitans sp. TaxID=1610747 RepID=UPI0035CAA03B
MLDFLYTAVSWVLLRWHQLFTALGFSQSSGFGWALSIVFLVITARVLLFRLFIKQVHYTRNMQKMQPKIQKLREKYKDDRAALNREMMALQQEEGFNPLSGCLPMLLQIPVFIGLYHVLRHLAAAASESYQKRVPQNLHIYTFSRTETLDAARAKIFNAPLAASFHDSSDLIRTLGGDATPTRITLVILLIISSSATFGTQLLVRRNATSAPEGTAATVQKLMLYLIPVGTLASGLLFNFPLGVLLYWFTSNLWTLGQQAYIIRYHPPTDEPVAPVGQLGKTLAPRPGQRPVRNGRPAGVSRSTDRPGAAADTDDGTAKTSLDKAKSADGARNASAASAAGSTTPRPGQRPNRGGNGKRPPAKRPTQAKKRR